MKRQDVYVQTPDETIRVSVKVTKWMRDLPCFDEYLNNLFRIAEKSVIRKGKIVINTYIP